MKRFFFSAIILASILLADCQPVGQAPTPGPATGTVTALPPAYLDASLPAEKRAADLLARMSLEEKIGQMAQVDKKDIDPKNVTKYFVGSILSGGGGSPEAANTPKSWLEMVDGYQKAALQTRLAIPILYGVDAVHGHNNLYGATIFPHNIGLGATRDPELVEKVGRATAEEMLATDIPWDFAPVIAVPQDIRWGRTYEGYGEDTGLVSEMGTAFLRGLQSMPEAARGQSIYVLGTPKHFIGDGGTSWGSSGTSNYKLDQGDTQIDEATLRAKFLPPYKAAVDAGAQSIMASFSSWNGTKMHAQKYLLTDVLKGELGFKGFVISDYRAINQVSFNYYTAVVTSINAGIDMAMLTSEYTSFISVLKQAVEKGDIPQARIDDAVLRILTVKFKLGLFDRPYRSDAALVAGVGSAAHRALAREAVAKSLVLLKNDKNALPLAKDTPLIFVAGDGADDIGLQSGGWTITWQGAAGNTTQGTTILQAIHAAATNRVEYDMNGKFADAKEENGQPAVADIGIVVFAEQPYAEGVGDSSILTIGNPDLLKQMRSRSKRLVVILLSGRPVIITDLLPLADAWVAAWLPGSEATGIADVLFGDRPFTGTLSYTWPRSVDQLPLKNGSCGTEKPLFPYGYGLDASTNQPLPSTLVCP